MAARRFWNATRHSRTCSINIPLLADWSRKCSSSFLARECGGRKRVIPDCTSARFTLTRKEVTRRKDELFEDAPRSRRVVILNGVKDPAYTPRSQILYGVIIRFFVSSSLAPGMTELAISGGTTKADLPFTE